MSTIDSVISIQLKSIILRINSELSDPTILPIRKEQLESELSYYIHQLSTQPLFKIENIIKNSSDSSDDIVTSTADLPKKSSEYSKMWHFIGKEHKIFKLKEFLKEREEEIKSKYPDKLLTTIESELIEMINNKQLKTAKEVKYDRTKEKIIKITTKQFTI